MQEERPVEYQVQEPKTINNNLATLALIVAVGALVLAWLSYDKQTIEDTKEAVQMEKEELNDKMKDAAQDAETVTREATGTVVEKTGTVMEATGQAAQEAGSDIKSDPNGASPR